MSKEISPAGRLSDGGPAFPHLGSDERVGVWIDKPGMTLRDYFAAKALSAILTGHEFTGMSASESVALAYEYADLMLKQRGVRE